jgi:predicted nucleic acid-binding protein
MHLLDTNVCVAWLSGKDLGVKRYLARLFALFPALPFDDADAEQYGPLRVQLRRAGTPVGSLT